MDRLLRRSGTGPGDPGHVALVAADEPVAQDHDARGVLGDVGLVRHEHDGDAPRARAPGRAPSPRPGPRVEVAGRLVGEDDAAAAMTSARAMATRCCWPPESWFGWWSTRSPSPTRSSASARALVALARGDARVEERQLDVLERARPREEVEALEDEAERPVADLGELVAVEPRDLLAGEPVGAERRPVEAAEDVHQRRLARAGRAHDRDELPLSMARETPRSARTSTSPIR